MQSTQANPLTAVNYDEVEQQFITLLEIEDLDKQVAVDPDMVRDFEEAIAAAISAAYQWGDDAAHLFLQRVLYRINRLKFFWYDDLQRYTNEKSVYLQRVLQRVEAVWQEWELAQTQIDVAALQTENVKQGLIDRAAVDVDPPISANGKFFRDQMTEAGYRQLVAIASLDGLVEASDVSRILGGVANDVHSVLTRLLLEEYGGGNLKRKHSSYFATMLGELDMNLEPEAYFDLVPWELLASLNHAFLLSDRKRYFLRYIGGLLYFETSVPAAFSNYQAAGMRLGLSSDATAYWNLHIKVDELHGRWMLNDVALPLVDRYPDRAWELLFGYDQKRLISSRASASVARSVREVDLPATSNV
ncbi:MAG: iron-containing redox enzyme family protein [Hormoscilla sp.]